MGYGAFSLTDKKNYSQTERGKWSHIPVQLAEGVKTVSAGLRQTTWITNQSQIINCGSTGQETRGKVILSVIELFLLKFFNVLPDVPSILNPLKVASGQKHNFILMGNNETNEPTGKIFGWGDNKFWQLAADPQKVPKADSLIPAEQLQDFDFKDLKSGWSHGAAITSTCLNKILISLPY
jgi:alpha-tubulin suppressor-like RCC1 family protein